MYIIRKQLIFGNQFKYIETFPESGPKENMSLSTDIFPVQN